MSDAPTTPEGWRLSPQEIESLAQEAIGEPAEGEHEWRPEGGSLLAGIGQCLHDEIRAIWDLVVLLKQFNDDIDLAADGVDNWEIWRSHVGDMATVFALLASLNAGRKDFGVLPRAQQLALFRVYAKVTAIKETLADMAKAGLNMIAAYDVFWNTDYEIFTFNQSENVLKALADAISLFFTDAEWLAMAEGGRDLADQVTSLIQQRFEDDPWGSSGYVACLVALFFSPTKLLRALRPLMAAFGRLGRSSSVADMARVLRTHNVDVPDWLGGRRDAPELETPPTRTDDAPDTTPEPDTETPLSRDDPEPARAENPAERETPEPNAATTRVRGTDHRRRPRAGTVERLTEDDVARRLNDAGYDTYNITNNSGHGTDIVAVKDGPPPEIRVVEVKSGGATPSGLQRQGGQAHTENVLVRRFGGDGRTDWVDGELRQRMRSLGLYERTWPSSPHVSYELWRYPDADVPAGNAGRPVATQWNGPLRGARYFNIDAHSGQMSGSPFAYRSRNRPENIP